MLINEVCDRLSDRKVPYAIVGGYAVALHGAVRGTFDIDFVTKWTLSNLKKIETVMKSLGLQSHLPISAEDVFHFRDEYINNRNLIAWQFIDLNRPDRQIDIIINYDLTGKKTKQITTGNGKLRILSIDDLIEMKKQSGRPQDLEDIAALKQLKMKNR